jgi:alanine racemase
LLVPKIAVTIFFTHKPFFLHSKTPQVIALFSHFAKAEDDADFTKKQFDNYLKGKEYFASCKITPEICHICNSAGTYSYPQMHLDAVRVGIFLYGAGTTDKNYIPAMSFNTSIVDIHEIEAGDGVSYGLDFVAEKPMRIAVIGAGYADGVRRSLSGKDTYFLCNGKRVKLIGRICMDMAMIDISDVTDAKVGDAVTVWGKNKNGFISCDEQAEKAGTICYELFCGVSERVPRIYTENQN